MDFGNPYSQIIIDNDGTLSVEFGAYGVPETFVIDKNKKIIIKICWSNKSRNSR